MFVLKLRVVSGCLAAAAVCLPAVCGMAQEVKPFPAYRVRDFYGQQARQALASPQPQAELQQQPELLPQFPGLDGGSFGHWGQNPEERSIDDTLNEVDAGNVLCNKVRHFGTVTEKAVTVCLTESQPQLSVVFDPQRLTLVDCWQQGFVRWGSSRFNTQSGIEAVGTQLLQLAPDGWQLPSAVPTRYLGYYRSGRRVVFSYQLGPAEVLDHPWSADGTLMRSLQWNKPLPAGTSLRLLPVTSDNKQIANFNNHHVTVIQNGEPRTVTAVQGLPSGTSFVIRDGSLCLDFLQPPASGTVHLQFGSSAAADRADQPAMEMPDLTSFKSGTTGQWVQQTVMTPLLTGNQGSAFEIDTLSVPYGTANPFGTPMRIVGVGVLAQGDIVVSTLHGDVWQVELPQQSGDELTWRRIAAGLYQPLGLVVQGGQIVLVGKNQLTRLHDLNQDGEADFYECLTQDYPTTGGHDFAAALQQDQQGRLYWATASRDFGLTRYAHPGRPESLGTGLRNSNGVGVSADGNMILASVQEGTWAAASAIFEVRDGSYSGHGGPREDHGPYGYDLPLCFIPRGIDNSCGGIQFLPEDDRLGPLSGRILGSSYGYCTYYLILRETVNGKAQGGIVPLPGEFLSGACRFAFSEHDGHIYVGGTEGWQSYATENGCLQRLRYTGRPLHLPHHVEARQNGLLVHFNTPLDPESVTVDNVFCQQWNYLYSNGYGSPEYSVREPGRQGHDRVQVDSVHLLPDQHSVFIEIPQLHPVMQFHLFLQLTSADGQAFEPEVYSSIYELGPAFTDFPGYRLVAKRAWPDFPKAEQYEQDPRLVAQETLGTTFGWVREATRLNLDAVPGLHYEPRRLRVIPGERVALTFRNTDPSMPHNVVILPVEKTAEFGEQAMVLASNPRAIATHYVPDDPSEICFSPIINPGDQYTVYFEAPQQTGEYRLLCTYPGHWKVMQGSLFVLPAGEPLPELSDEPPTRRFVRSWTLADLAADAEQLQNRSVQQGRTVFRQAGCIKCHRLGNEGTKLGPDLDDVSRRFPGSNLLQQILQPSAEINKDYQTWVAVQLDGRVQAGLLVGADDSQITLLPNPLQPEQQVSVPRSQIDTLEPAPQSTMPEGLLMTFSRDEILDLLAYIRSATPDSAATGR